MDTVTYPTPAVSEFIQHNMIPVRIVSDQDNRSIFITFEIRWTPTLITLDKDGKEHFRTVGFLRPEPLIASLMLGIGKIHFDRREYKEAISEFDKLVAQYPKTVSAPEAVYYRGVAGSKATNDLKPLKEAYGKLSAEYPTSEWTERAYPYSLLK